MAIRKAGVRRPRRVGPRGGVGGGRRERGRPRAGSMDAPLSLLEARDMTRRFGALHAVAGVSLHLVPGEIVGLVGKNGAGKTTLLRLLAGTLRLDGGSIAVAGHPPGTSPARRALGFAPDGAVFPPTLTVRAALDYYSRLHAARPEPRGLVAAAPACSRSCSTRRRACRRPGSGSPRSASRRTWATAPWKRSWRCAGRTASPCGRPGCGSHPWKTWCWTRWTTTPGADYVSPPMSLQLYNTLTRQVEAFAPLAPPRVTMYTCGPTVWNFAHIGNFRTFLFEDLLRRHLEASGYDVFHIMNLTDVDDRVIKAAAAAGTTLRRHTEPFVRAFFEYRDYLRLRPAHVHPRATESVPAMIVLVRRLLERGVAYRGEDGSVYLAIAKFPGYGRLSRLDRREIKVGARVASDEYAK